MNDGKLVKEEHLFKVKEIPRVITTINGNSNITVLSKNQFKDAVIKTNFNSDDFIYGLEVTIVGFRVFLITKKGKKIKEIVVQGNTFNEECLEQIDKLNMGDYIIVDKQELTSNIQTSCILTSPVIVLIYEL